MPKKLTKQNKRLVKLALAEAGNKDKAFKQYGFTYRKKAQNVLLSIISIII